MTAMYFGKTVCAGIVMGTVTVRGSRGGQVERKTVRDAGRELARVRDAVAGTDRQLERLCGRAKEAAGKSGAAIFAAQRVLLEDEEYLGEIERIIRAESVNAEYAVSAAGERFAALFEGMDDDCVRARAADVREVTARVVQNLLAPGEASLVRESCAGAADAEASASEPAPGAAGAKDSALEPATGAVDVKDSAHGSLILVTDDLTPGEIVQTDRSRIRALVTVGGAVNSHAAILARMMNIPMLVGVPLDLNTVHTGMQAIVDAGAGTLLLDPEEAQYAQAKERQRKERERKRQLEEQKGKKNVTGDGRQIGILANIGYLSEVDDVLANDAGGIGLFRSEFLYLDRSDYPSEEEQFLAYRQLAQALGQKRVVIRTLDIGADKQADYFGLEREENPALGCRAIRICFRRPDIFKTQLRALFRAAVYGNLSVMYPMIISADEVKRIFEIVKEVERELKRDGVSYRVPEQGIMIETPAAVMVSDELAELVDFFSIGTNDLTQYTLAVDRNNRKLDDFYNPHHKAILRMIQMVVDHAHRCGKRVGICGELGADLALTETFVDMGVDELSVAPSMVLQVRERVRQV